MKHNSRESQPTPLSQGLIKQGNTFNKSKGETVTQSKNPANSKKHGGELINQSRNHSHF